MDWCREAHGDLAGAFTAGTFNDDRVYLDTLNEVTVDAAYGLDLQPRNVKPHVAAYLVHGCEYRTDEASATG